MTRSRLGPRLNETGRVEAFSDGVFAIAATLLVLDLRVPAPGTYLAAIAGDLSALVAYLAAFLTITSIWLHHHDVFSRISRIDARLVLVNLALLFGVSALPWPTSLLAASLRHGERADQIVAVSLYAGVSLLIAVAWSVLTWVLARRGDLLRARNDSRWMRATFVSVLLSTIPVLAAVPVAFAAPTVSLFLYVAVPVAFFALSVRRTEPPDR